MSKSKDDVTQEIEVTAPKKRTGGRHALLVIREDGTSETHPLPATGSVVLGRAADCHVRIDDPSISRRHAILHMGPPIRVEDLGSANGTRIRDARLDEVGDVRFPSSAELEERVLRPNQPEELAAGDVIHLGRTMAFVQMGAPMSRLRRLWPHGYFEGCLEKECARSERSGSSFAVLRVRVEKDVRTEDVEEALGVATRSVDIVAMYGPGEYEVLLVDADPAKVDEVKSRLSAKIAGRGGRARIGIARYPNDGRDPESLVATAGARVRGIETMEGLPRAVIVQDPAMQRLYKMAHRIADSGISVLLLGETGVGKEVLAEAIHALSPRAKKPFLRLNCAAFAEQLLEAELFGYERGAFTGAMQAKQGLLETANGGTVFLDEVGELPTATQAKLLRVLEERQVRHVGGLTARPIDVRFIAATNRDLEVEIERGAFREDLFFRLNGISLVIPPLRERPSEIEPFARAFVADLCRKQNRHPEPELSPEALELLRHYSYPGNIRELRNLIERALLLCVDDVITPEHLPVEKMGATLPWRREGAPDSVRSIPPPAFDRATPIPVPPTYVPPPPDTVDAGAMLARLEPGALSAADLRARMAEVEKARVLQALEQCAGNQTKAAKLLGISRRTLITRLDEYKVPRPRKATD